MLAVKNSLFIYILIIFILKCKSKDYCSADTCNNNKQHTLCKFQSPNPANHCIEFEFLIKTPDEKIAILNKINSRRNKVALGELKSLKSAESMLKLEWNEDLALSAQRWANQCVKHNVPDIKDFCRDLRQESVEQNIATIHGEAPGLSLLALIDVWYMELLNFNASFLSRYKPSVQTGFLHYDYFTQLIWADTTQVGCGGVKFKEQYESESGLRNRTIYRLVCNFAPGGNRENESVYSVGLPCSRCPLEYICDIEFKALCGPKNPNKTSIINLKYEPDIEKTTAITSEFYDYSDVAMDFIEKLGSAETADKIKSTDQLQFGGKSQTPFEYFSNLHVLTKHGKEEAASLLHTCKEELAVDEFISLLKKKLSNDPMFKEMLVTKSLLNNAPDNTYTDASVADFVSKIYSKKIPTTTSKTPNNDLINSTLLVDLIEAVIFRSGGKYSTSEITEQNTQPEHEVSPVKIQAELAEVKPNHDFTGHYFFPEDEEELITETTESYDDTFSVPASDIIQEIEEIKKITTTKDFLDDILESDVVVESTSSPTLLSPDDISIYKSGHNVMKKFLENIGDKGERARLA
ncbi:uncharacterized protein LOC115449578 [Manduca sexta]|uniref:SCP domain-containing protein n=1 Tax=Manduca sexta TaxID=7130 RepID=A0A922CV73_MANSE|nr:uncharacterized protein LOC115449578 [Manduca sexta]KAG6459622.1 hypothetical protein O3G_MSEX011483 [Manduca sexta]